MLKYLGETTIHKSIQERDDLSEIEKNSLHRKLYAPETFGNWFYGMLSEEEQQQALEILRSESVDTTGY